MVLTRFRAMDKKDETLTKALMMLHMCTGHTAI